MKHILIVLLTLIAFNSNAQTLKPRIEISYYTMSQQYTMMKPIIIGNVSPERKLHGLSSYFGNYSFKTGLVFNYKNFSIENDAKIFCNKKDWSKSSFSPVLAIWDFKVNYEIIKGLKVSFFHQCIHKVDNLSDPDAIGLYGGGEGFSISYGY